MGCNCKRKHNVINNLSIPSYVQLGIDAWNKVKDKREELLQIIEKVQSYKKQVYVKRK